MSVPARRKLRFEGLENRRLLEGNVAATLHGGILFVIGDAAANGVAIDPAAKGVQVSGDATTQINGQASPVVFENVKSLMINMKGGDDQVALGGGAAGVLAIPRDAWIALGSGADQLTVNAQVGRRLTISGGSGDDQITLSGSTIGRSAQIRTGDGADAVSVVDTSVAKDLAIRTGGDDDRSGEGDERTGDGEDGPSAPVALGTDVLVENSQIGRNLLIHTGAGDDAVTIDNTSVARLAAVFTGAGDDTVTISDAAQVTNPPPSQPFGLTAQTALIVTGSGADSVAVAQTSVDRFFADLGKGDDVLALDASNVFGHAFLNGGRGTDTLQQNGQDTSGFLVFGFEAIGA
jgi:large repetitive protein